jgi:hypothetical protein
LVTGARDFPGLANRLPIEVLSPRGYWEKLHGTGKKAPQSYRSPHGPQVRAVVAPAPGGA